MRVCIFQGGVVLPISQKCAPRSESLCMYVRVWVCVGCLLLLRELLHCRSAKDAPCEVRFHVCVGGFGGGEGASVAAAVAVPDW